MGCTGAPTWRAGPEGTGRAVLLTGGEPLEGKAVMQQRRGRIDQLTDGPGKLAQALGIDGSHDGTRACSTGPVRLLPRMSMSPASSLPPGLAFPRPKSGPGGLFWFGSSGSDARILPSSKRLRSSRLIPGLCSATPGGRHSKKQPLAQGCRSRTLGEKCDVAPDLVIPSDIEPAVRRLQRGERPARRRLLDGPAEAGLPNRDISESEALQYPVGDRLGNHGAIVSSMSPYSETAPVVAFWNR